MLTADDAGEIFVGTENNDTFTAEAGALDGTSVDGRGGNDTLNATYNSDDIAGDWTPTIRNVENVNVDIDAFDGTATTVEADNIRNANITLSSTKLGFNGTAGVAAAGDNSVIAGENVTALTVAGLTEGSVDAGSAETVTVDSETAGENTLNLTVNGDVATVIGSGTAFNAVNLTTTADAEVELNTSIFTDNVLTVAGEGNVTLLSADELSGEEIVNALESGELVADVDQTGADGSDWDVDSVNISAAIGAFTAAEGAVVDLEATQTALTLTGQSATTGTVTVNTEVDQTSLTFATLSEATVNVNDEVTIGTLVTGGADTTVNVAADTTISTLTAAGDDVFVTGEGNVTIGGTAADADLVDASGLSGALDFTQSADTNIDVVGSEGDDDLTVATVDAQANVVTGNGTNTVTFADLDGGTIAVTGGAGNDTVNIGGAGAVGTNGAATVALELGAGDDTVALGDLNSSTASTFALEFGEGNDTLSLTDGDDISAENITVSGLEAIDMNGSATVAAELVSGQSYTILGGGLANGTLSVVDTGTNETVDLSNLSFDNTVTNGAVATDVNVNGGGENTIITSEVADAITVDGNDTIDFTQNASIEASTDSIIGFTTNSDVIKLGIAANSNNFVAADANTGTGTNELADADAAITYAEANSFDGTVQVAFLTDSDSGVNGWLVYDSNADGTADEVIQMSGLTATTDVVAADIIA
ncbi:hypothetical protein [Halomonas sp. 707B3]|uniref:beta strand repeat-containing protein n=1 Tax=Halomonas sp. 707B3 TaxID=1681043 RepID=UPI0020A171ED|nr:hypothetical protein [Halomonas sp. 707B3]MCP1319087.1 hypothetical protein [Halomonas sp. 707B3]